MLRAYGDGNLFGEPYGVGPVQVVWLHGWGRRAQDFDEAATRLAERGVASVALDLPGFGSSPPPVVAGGARQYAKLVAPALADLADGPVVLVGHSFGGRVATVIAADHPELVRSLLLTGVPLVRLAPSVTSPRAFRAIRWLHDRGMIDERRMEAARQKYGSADYRAASGVMRQVLVATVNESYEDELDRITVPVALVWGTNDREVPLEIARRSASLLHVPCTITTLDGVGHLVPVDAVAALVNAVLEVLR